MSTVHIFGFCGALLVGIGLHGVILHREWLRKLISMNVLSAGIFLIYGVVARHGGVDAFRADPVPQALTITGIVVAFVATSMTVALLLRWLETERIPDSADDSACDPDA